MCSGMYACCTNAAALPQACSRPSCALYRLAPIMCLKPARAHHVPCIFSQRHLLRICTSRRTVPHAGMHVAVHFQDRTARFLRTCPALSWPPASCVCLLGSSARRLPLALQLAASARSTCSGHSPAMQRPTNSSLHPVRLRPLPLPPAPAICAQEIKLCRSTGGVPCAVRRRCFGRAAPCAAKCTTLLPDALPAWGLHHGPAAGPPQS
jgi:hypothetical protein